MTITEFIEKLTSRPDEVSFEETMQVIDSHYSYRASTFNNGDIRNEAGNNEGSCKIFAFAREQQLTDDQTLACFGDYYRIDVLQHPDADSHANIRQFMQTGLAGIRFEQEALIPDGN